MTNTNSFTVVTFNIRYDNEKDGRNSWQERKEAVGSVIGGLNPDILGIQEGLHHQVLFLEEKFPDLVRIGVGRDDGTTTGEFCALFYNPSRFSLIDSGTFWLSETPDKPGSRSWGSACTRICTWMVARLNSNPIFPVLFMNAHLDHQSQVAREYGSILMISRMKSILNSLDLHQGVRIVLLGDYNVHSSNERALETFLACRDPISFKDARTSWISQGGSVPSFTWHQFTGKKPKVHGNQGLLDFLFFSVNLELVEFGIFDKRVDGRYPSDHFPLVGKFKVS